MSKLTLLLLGLPGVSLFAFSVAAAETLPSATTLIVPIIVIFILVLLNGLFVAAEFSIIGVRSTQMEQLAEEGNSTAQRVVDILDSRDKQDSYIATAQLGITIASLGLAMYAEPEIAHFIEPYLAEWFNLNEATVGTIGYVVALSFLTYLHIVIGEMVPKSIALTDAVRAVLVISPIMRVAGSPFLLGIPVRILNSIGRGLLRLLGVPPAEGHARVLSPEELELIVTESAEGGLLNEEEEEMIRNIFDFSDRVVEQVMTPRTKVQAVPHTMHRDELLTFVAESRHSRFPVYENDRDHIIGVLHVKDLMRQTLNRKGAFDMRLVLRSVPAVPEGVPVEKMLALFKRQRLHMAVVLDEFGGMAGIVTLEDLVEEVVGEVRDEFDQEKEPYVEIGPGIVEIAGDYLVDDLKESIFLGEDDDLPDVETVAGLVVTKLGRLPVVGDYVTYSEGVEMHVLAVDRRAVSRVRISFPAPEQKESQEKAGDAGKQEEE